MSDMDAAQHVTPPVNGGKFLMERRTVKALLEMSPLAVKLFMWLLARANFRDRDKLRRGQCVATIAEMQDALTYYAGFRRVAPTHEQCRSAYEALRQAAMITTAKTTRGMIVTICNYAEMQEMKKRETRNETRNETGTKPGGRPHDTERNMNERNERKTTASAGIVLPDWLPIDSWLAFVEMRKKLKKPMTGHAMQLAIQKLGALRNAGHDVGAIIDSSVLNGWQDLYPPRQGSVSSAASVVTPAASTTLDPKRAADIRRTLAELDGAKC